MVSQKNEFDKWVLHQKNHPPCWYGLKFFNVYGPNEYHKGRMASVIFHSFNQIKNTGQVKLFKSHRPDFEDGKQLRDFVYVKDVMNVCYWLMDSCNQGDEVEGRRDQFQSTETSDAKVKSGLYNLGTGKARSFQDLVSSTFAALDLSPNIEFIDMPMDIRETYQYFTEANMQKLKTAGFQQPFHSLEKGVDDYVRNYLSSGKRY